MRWSISLLGSAPRSESLTLRGLTLGRTGRGREDEGWATEGPDGVGEVSVVLGHGWGGPGQRNSGSRPWGTGGMSRTRRTMSQKFHPSFGPTPAGEETTRSRNGDVRLFFDVEGRCSGSLRCPLPLLFRGYRVGPPKLERKNR